jgi:hypothetical protein
MADMVRICRVLILEDFVGFWFCLLADRVVGTSTLTRNLDEDMYSRRCLLGIQQFLGKEYPKPAEERTRVVEMFKTTRQESVNSAPNSLAFLGSGPTFTPDVLKLVKGRRVMFNMYRISWKILGVKVCTRSKMVPSYFSDLRYTFPL